MKVELNMSGLSNERGLKLIPENDLERQELANFIGDVTDTRRLEIEYVTLTEWPHRFTQDWPPKRR